ncbi:hypothetical protein [Maioricimonas sp. JC845]|uniref:hypothetical protein n=1 Tax=Maioricimonas sp. JC845 TaxID=3232138 RepID=UPI003457D7C7
MANSQGIRAGRAYVELFTDNSRLVRGLKAAERRLKAFGAGVRAVGAGLAAGGAALLTPLTLAAREFASAGDDLHKMAARTGIGARQLSALGFAAEQSGGSLQDVEKAVRRMQQTILDAERGSSTATDALENLGLTLGDLQGLTPDEQFRLIADRLSQIEDPGRRAAVSMLTFGRAGQKLLPLLNEGADGISALQAEAESLGITLTDEDAQAAAALTDAMNRVTRVARATIVQLGGALAPTLTRVANLIATTSAQVSDWIRNNRGLVTTVAAVAAGLVLAGGMLIGAGVAFTAAGMAAGAVATVLTTLGAIIGGLLSPVGLLTSAVAALGAWFLTSSSAGMQAIALLRGTFGPLVDEALAAFGAIRNALASGDFSAAANVLWSTLRLWWIRGTGWLMQQWERFRGMVLNVWHSVQEGLARGFLEVVDLMRDAWSTFTSAFSVGAVRSARTAMLAYVGLLELTGQIEKATARAMRTGINIAAGTQVGSIESARDQEITAREQQRQAGLAELDALRKQDADSVQRRLDAEIARAERAAAAARAEFEQTVSDAEALTGGPGGGPLGPFDPSAIFDRLTLATAGLPGRAGGLDFGLSPQQQQFLRMQAAGTGTSPEEEAADHLAEMKRTQQQIVDLLEDGNRIAREQQPPEEGDFG